MKETSKIENRLTFNILELLQTMQDACQELYSAAEMQHTEPFQQLSADMSDGLCTILHLIEGSDTAGNKKLQPILQSVLDTLHRVGSCFLYDLDTCLKKIEFELLPLLQEAYGIYYFFQYVASNPEKLSEYYAEKKNQLFGNAYIDEALETGHYKYDLSIKILAYNKLEYTRQCVQSVLDNIPAGLNYELILVNNGSTDGTKEYFESLHPNKQFDIAVNSGIAGAAAATRILEGEFELVVSNDTIITPHAIENLLTCIRSDPQIAFVVPTTPNTSNFQTIRAQYHSREEMLRFACKNNHSDPMRWEQRVRLCNPICIIRNSVYYASNGLCADRWYHTVNPVHADSFPDDRLSLLLRRNGYKLMLAKDAYCFHFGSVTLKDEIQRQNEQQYYLEGRKEFYKAFQVDPWGTGFCYDSIFLDRIVGEEQNHVDVLGINCGLGSNSLKIKDQLKEYCHNADCTLINITDDSRFTADLKGISDKAALVQSIKALKTILYKRQFQYIVWEDSFLEKYKYSTLLELCMEHTALGGHLLIKRTPQSQPYIKRNLSGRRALGNDWIMLEKESGKTK